MMTGKQYRESLADGRVIYFKGKRVDDVGTVPALRNTVEKVARTYDRFHDPAPGAVNPLVETPRDRQAMSDRLPALQQTDKRLTATYMSYMVLLTAADRIAAAFPEGAARARAYVQECRERDIRMVQCITDSKGDRTHGPAGQVDPDQYLRVIERRPDGVVIRGAKLHITGCALAHEMMVIPTKRMKAGEEDYAIACGVPVNAPGVKIVTVVPSQDPDADPRDQPLSQDQLSAEGFVIFDDVFVPHERIFLDGQVDESASFAHSLGLWERLGSMSHEVERATQLVGLAQLIAEANGTHRISHIRDKINDMALHATMLKAGYKAAVADAKEGPDGAIRPDELFTNATKIVGASNWSLMVRHLHDIAGGSAATVPSMADFDNPETHDALEKYMSGAPGVSGEYRAQLFHLIRNLTADSFGGWASVTTLQSGGGLYAQRLVMRKHFDIDEAKAEALRLLPSPSAEVNA
jgi:4-hydroxybutyryl-CoA dehydratase/vinylacetyl-CoA-Delta-isomerase